MRVFWAVIRFLKWVLRVKHGVKMAVSPKYRRAVKGAKEEEESEEIYGTE